MTQLLGKNIRPSLIERIEEERKGKTLSFYLFSNKDDLSSQAYLKGVKKALERFSIPYEEEFLDRDDIQGSLHRFATKAKKSHTILARPLGIKEEQAFLSAIDPDHDPDMTTERNIGRLVLGDMDYLPATARSVQLILDYYHIDLTGKKCLIIGRSRTIGLPLYALISHKNGLVVQAHSRIPSSLLKKEAQESDVLFLASGKRGLLSQDDLIKKPYIIDCGYQEDGGGDMGFVPEEGTVLGYTPVPGGVGVLTSYCLVLNALLLERKD